MILEPNMKEAVVVQERYNRLFNAVHGKIRINESYVTVSPEIFAKNFDDYRVLMYPGWATEIMAVAVHDGVYIRTIGMIKEFARAGIRVVPDSEMGDK